MTRTVTAIPVLDRPVIQAPMAGVQDWRLAAAVASARGLGSIACGMLRTDQVITQVQSFRAAIDAPYNLNFFCHSMPQLEDAVLERWQDVLARYYWELELSPSSSKAGLRRPFDIDMVDALEPYRPPVMSFHFGLPAPSLLERVKSWGSCVISTATTLEEGQWLQDNGADVVIAQGLEAGGHRGMFLSEDLATQRDTQSLTEELLDALSIPVIAAGGIGDADDVRRYLSAGVCAVQVGTAYLLCDEADTSELHRSQLRNATAQTALTNLFSGRPARGIRNRLMQELGELSPLAPAFPYASLALGPLRAAAEAKGRSDFTPLWAGERRPSDRYRSAAELTRALCAKLD